LWRSGRSHANRDGAGMEGTTSVQVVVGMGVGVGVAPDLEENEAQQTWWGWSRAAAQQM
jgi:hypothetical protein